ncbi:MAG TPA: cation diffusion facilitator family transporter [bacterium]|nr:cation diffusion facilitator family transporter [bacterium]
MDKKINPTTDVLKISILTALGLALMKFAAGYFTHSMAVIASGLDSAMDMATSFVNFIAAREAAKPPDDDHAYGHGKIESLASLFQSLLIGLSGLFVVFESIRRFVSGTYLRDLESGIIIMVTSMTLTLLLVWKLGKTTERHHSLILTTEKLHYSMDVFTNGGAIAALLLVKITGFVFWDLLCSIAVALFVFKISAKIFRNAVDELLDKSLSPVSKEEIENLIQGFNPSIGGLHNFRSRRVGKQIFLDFHVEIRGEEDFRKAHLMTEDLIDKIREKYLEADVTVHYDPEGER